MFKITIIKEISSSKPESSVESYQSTISSEESNEDQKSQNLNIDIESLLKILNEVQDRGARFSISRYKIKERLESFKTLGKDEKQKYKNTNGKDTKRHGI